MLNNLRIALAAIIMALAAVSFIDSASAQGACTSSGCQGHGTMDTYGFLGGGHYFGYMEGFGL